MKEQNDNKKTYINSYSQNSFPNENLFLNKSTYNFANKKTEKLVTALYMVTDCMETEDALKEKLRLLGVDLLSLVYRLSTLLPTEKHLQLSSSLNKIYEILSFIEVANTIGYISDMNTNILKKEFNILIDELNQHLPKEMHFPFSLDEEMFQVLPDVKRTESLSLKENKIKRTNSMSFINVPERNNMGNKTNNNVFYKHLPNIDYKKVKSERVEKIMSIIKDKVQATIKDISSSVIDCSEKTIQRELNELIENGKIKKTGDKRWSRYMIITTEKRP